MIDKFNLVQVDVSSITESDFSLLKKKVLDSGYKLKNSHYMIINDVKHYFSIGKDSFFVGQLFPGRSIVTIDEFLAINDSRPIPVGGVVVGDNIFEENIFEDDIYDASVVDVDVDNDTLATMIKRLVDYGSSVGLSINVNVG